MRFTVRGSLEFRASLEKRYFLSSSVVSRRKDYWVFEVDDGMSSESFAERLRQAGIETRGCQALVDDWVHLAVHAPMQRIVKPGTKPCSKKAKEKVGHLHLCVVHARLAREGLVDKGGEVASRPTIRDVHKYPKSFPYGFFTWFTAHRLGVPAWP